MIASGAAQTTCGERQRSRTTATPALKANAACTSRSGQLKGVPSGTSIETGEGLLTYQRNDDISKCPPRTNGAKRARAVVPATQVPTTASRLRGASASTAT